MTNSKHFHYTIKQLNSTITKSQWCALA